MRIKILIVIGLLLLVSSKMRGQYMPVLDGDSIIQKVSVEVFDAWIPSEVYIYGDTLIEGRMCRFVASGSLEYGIMPVVVGYTREDTINGKLWFRRYRDNLERLVMDLSLNIGDSVDYYEYSPCYQGSSTVTSITEENSRKHVNFDCDLGNQITDSLQYVEGIGPNWSLFYQTLDINRNEPSGGEAIHSGFAYRVCEVYRDTELIWTTPCDIGTSTSEFQDIEIRIYPNPVKNILQIDTEHPLESIMLYSFSGKLIFKTKGDSIVDMSSLPDGIYLIVLKDIFGNAGMRRIVK